MSGQSYYEHCLHARGKLEGPGKHATTPMPTSTPANTLTAGAASATSSLVTEAAAPEPTYNACSANATCTRGARVGAYVAMPRAAAYAGATTAA